MLEHNLCLELALRLKPEEKKKILQVVMQHGYGTKEIAKMVGVSPSAVSRYISGTLYPPAERICRLAETVEQSISVEIYKIMISLVWSTISKVLKALIRVEPEFHSVAEAIADEVSSILLEARRRRVRSEGVS